MPQPFTDMAARPSLQQRPISVGRNGIPLFGNATSRSSSPANPGRRITKLNLYLQRLAANSAEQLERGSILGVNTRVTNIKRWDGNQRTTTNWDGLRRVCSDRTSHQSLYEYTQLRRSNETGSRAMVSKW